LKRITAILLVLLFLVTAFADEKYQVTDIIVAPHEKSTSITVYGSGMLEYSVFDMVNPDRFVLDIFDALMPDKPLSYEYYPPVKRISLQPFSNQRQGLRLIVEYQAGAEYDITRTTNSVVISFAKLSESVEPIEAAPEKPAWLKKKVNLTVEDGAVSAALNLISRKAGFDLVVSDIVENRIWVNLNDVPVDQALEAILSASGNTYYVSGQVVVATRRPSKNKNELITEIYRLNYTDAAGFAESIKETLSPEAVVKIINAGKPDNQSSKEHIRFLLLTDLPEKHQLVKKIISRVDTAPKQVAISVKFIESNITGEETFGIDWNKMVTMKLTGANPDVTTNETGSASGYSAYSPWPPKKSSFVYGSLTVSEATAVLNYLHNSGKSRLLSDPSVTTTDGKQATISVTTTIPIQTINRFSEGSVIQDIVTYEYKEVGITLNVTPRINEQGRITLLCSPSVEEITGWVGPANNQQPITTKRSVETEVVAVDGETIVIGGLYKEGKIENESKLWLLGDIPILGHLFRTKTITKTKTDLMIFITPKIID